MRLLGINKIFGVGLYHGESKKIHPVSICEKYRTFIGGQRIELDENVQLSYIFDIFSSLNDNDYMIIPYYNEINKERGYDKIKNITKEENCQIGKVYKTTRNSSFKPKSYDDSCFLLEDTEVYLDNKYVKCQDIINSDEVTVEELDMSSLTDTYIIETEKSDNIILGSMEFQFFQNIIVKL